MKLHKHEQARLNIAGLASPAQQAEMKLILADRWSPLKPLPVFKYETAEYRASIHFDKVRGEWVCRKTSFPSNSVQELRGGLAEITSALPHGQEEVFTDAVGAEQQEQELEREATRRLQAILEWRENYESGALYSGLQEYLSESQQEEIYDSLRLSLTARQLQFTPKNVAFVFDALVNAGGRLATLVEIAQRKKARQEPASGAQAAAAGFQAEHIFSNPSIRDEEAVPRCSEMLPPESTNTNSTALVDEIKPQLGSMPIPSGSHVDSGDLMVGSGAEISAGDSPQSLEASFPSERAKNFAPKPINTSIGELLGGQTTSSRQRIVPRIRLPHRYVLEISGFQIVALVSLFAVISLTVGLAVGRGLLGKRLRDAQKSIVAVDTPAPALPNRPGETTSRTVNLPALQKEESRSEGPPAQSVDARSADSANRVRPTERSSAVTSEPLVSGGPRNLAPRRITPATTLVLHSSPHSAILVTGPGDGSKPFRVILPEKPIAASSSFAMTSQLSVLVSPEPGLAMSHKPARLQAGELVSFVWPRYPMPGDRYESSETVKVRTTIGTLGQVEDIRLVSGSTSLLPAAMSAIRLWRYKPTLLNNSPVQAQQDVTIEFRPPRICRTCSLSIHHTTSRGSR
jgi:TonB family protein